MNPKFPSRRNPFHESVCISSKTGPIEEQVLKLTDGRGVYFVIIAGGGAETFGQAVKCLKPGGRIGSVNYLGSGESVAIPRVEWGVGMGRKQINGGLNMRTDTQPVSPAKRPRETRTARPLFLILKRFRRPENRPRARR